MPHTNHQMKILNKFYDRLKKERFVNNQSSSYYGSLSNRFVIPGIVITGLSSIVSFMSTSDILEDDEKKGFGITVGVLTSIAAIIQSMSASFGFQLKKDAFATCADEYDSLITRVEFEICNPNEDFQTFSNTLEDDILKIKSNCKYLPPLHVNELWDQKKELFLNKLVSTSEIIPISNNETKSDETKSDETKSDEIKNDETKSDKTKSDETKIEISTQ